MPRQQSHHQTAWLHREGRVWMKGEEGGGCFVREVRETRFSFLTLFMVFNFDGAFII
jgi:hypothetical protein